MARRPCGVIIFKELVTGPALTVGDVGCVLGDTNQTTRIAGSGDRCRGVAVFDCGGPIYQPGPPVPLPE